jgi:hypothetical protein
MGHVVQWALATGAVAALIAATIFWRRNAPSLRAIRTALRRSTLIIPEASLPWYDARYLAQFARAARRAPIDGGGNAFDLYRAPALRWNDEKFAAALAAALALANLASPRSSLCSPMDAGLPSSAL